MKRYKKFYTKLIEGQICKANGPFKWQPATENKVLFSLSHFINSKL